MLNQKKLLSMAIIEGVIEGVEVSEQKEKDGKKYYKYEVKVGGDSHVGYIVTDTPNVCLVLDKNDIPLAEKGMVQFVTAKNGNTEYIKNETLLVMGLNKKVAEKAAESVQNVCIGLSVEQEVRAYSLQAAANMVGRLQGTQLKSKDVITVADEFYKYIKG